jgi:spore maturation protein CgeB
VRVAIFCHSLRSDWNHGNAHFLRGVATEFVSRGHDVVVYVPRAGWSVTNLVDEAGPRAIERFHDRYPGLREVQYDAEMLDLEEVLDGVSLVVVHEWNTHDVVRRIGEHRSRNPEYRLLFHDTHHRSLTDRQSIADYNLRHYDGVLAFGAIIRDLYLAKGWTPRAWVWHEAADTRVFHPIAGLPRMGDVVWVGNWGDDERTAELYEFLFDPVTAEGLVTNVYGVRYPEAEQSRLRDRGINYLGWLENFRVPEVFARHAVTLHVPRRPYVQALPGIPTIRPFEALACGIPLVSSPWDDVEGLFTCGRDYLVARNGREMRRHLRDLVHDHEMAAELALHGHLTILSNHTCAHRVDELLAICHELGLAERIRN